MIKLGSQVGFCGGLGLSEAEMYKAMSDVGVRDLESYNSILEAEDGQKVPQGADLHGLTSCHILFLIGIS